MPLCKIRDKVKIEYKTQNYESSYYMDEDDFELALVRYLREELEDDGIVINGVTAEIDLEIKLS